MVTKRDEEWRQKIKAKDIEIEDWEYKVKELEKKIEDLKKELGDTTKLELKTVDLKLQYEGKLEK